MKFLNRFFNRPSPLIIVRWEMLPSLSVNIFGSVNNVPDIQHIENSLNKFLHEYYQSNDIENISDEYRRLLSKKYQVISIPAVSEFGLIDKPSRLGEQLYAIEGEILLLLEGNTTIPAADGEKVLNVLSEFALSPQLMFVQGQGYHAFVRKKALLQYEFCRKGRLRDHCKKWGFSWKRVDYITINPQSNEHYEL